jgi:tRNA modification GTPase
MNKCDLVPDSTDQPLDMLFTDQWSPAETVRCSAVTGDGLARLEDVLARVALGGEALNAEDTLIENARQANALREAMAGLDRTMQGLRASVPIELVCIDLRAALEAVGSVTGLNVSEAVLDRIFSDFCIGK